MNQILTPVQNDRIFKRENRFKRLSFWVQIGLLLILLVAPMMGSFRLMDVAAKIMIFTVVVASYDLILGYTGLLSLAHALFFGIGAYSIALMCYHSSSPQWYHLILAVGASIVVSVALALILAFFSLRTKAIFFAMMSLALADFFHILGITWTDLTLGEDGISFSLPGILNIEWAGFHVLGLNVNPRLLCYYIILIGSVALFLFLLCFVKSPVGRVLQSIRENEPRSVALGFKTFHYQVYSIVFGSAIASFGGIFYGLWLRYVDPESVLSVFSMVDYLLMVIIGGLGTLYGAIIGVAFFMITQAWLPDLLSMVADLFPSVEILHRLADRWMAFLGLFFIIAILVFPKGVVGTIRDKMERHRKQHS